MEWERTSSDQYEESDFDEFSSTGDERSDGYQSSEISMNNQMSFRIQEAGFEVEYDPPKDGDCFYHAAAHQLGISCEAVKKKVFTFLESNRIDDENYVKVIEPEGKTVGTLYLGMVETIMWL
ncbi:hypothetical protein OS493_008040 [Desmophyllum pertusum]|uniref:OTU domain-containing protein n=1 Tax=Desmophyllum pertusum TaxID=174260 RepID=A0A9W9YFD8_9CNID|nr:hypothetical protein OS493_008040 [Desmophyllum pertusum]